MKNVHGLEGVNDLKKDKVVLVEIKVNQGKMKVVDEDYHALVLKFW